MCYKKTGDHALASKDYYSLKRKFNRNQHYDIVKYLFGLLLVPIQEDKKVI